MQILIFGNELVEQDSLPIKILPKLKELFPKIKFKHIDPVENLKNQIEEKHLVIIDTVKGINKTQLINLKQIKTQKVYSMHDFDLGYNLLLLKKLNLIESAIIIGVPMGISEETAIEGISEFLSNLPVKNE